MVLGTFWLKASQPLELRGPLTEAATAAVDRTSGARRDNMVVVLSVCRAEEV
jgi:hypothetical protein